jgi:transposase
MGGAIFIIKILFTSAQRQMDSDPVKVIAIGIDLTKPLFEVYGLDEEGRVAVFKQLNRPEFARYFEYLDKCLIGIAIDDKHATIVRHWAKRLEGYGHTVQLMAPEFIKPYINMNRHGEMDAEAICEAVIRTVAWN